MSQTQYILWGRGSSTNVQKVIWLCELLDMKPERRIVGGAHGGLDTSEYALMNPNRTIPVLQSPNCVVWESHAILRYLARTEGGGKYYGVTALENAAVDQWLDWFSTVFWPPVRGLFLDVFVGKKWDWDAPETLVLRDRIQQGLGRAADQMNKHGYLAGDQMTLADISLGIGLGRLMKMPFPVEIPEVLQELMAKLREQPAYILATETEPVIAGYGVKV